MPKRHYKIRSKVIQYPGFGGWHFLVVSRIEAAAIRKNFAALMRGWGSLPVMVALGKTKWKTSIFWDKKSDCFLLPLKSVVRKKEKVGAGETVTYGLELLV
jgi:hypothetical protein